MGMCTSKTNRTRGALIYSNPGCHFCDALVQECKDNKVPFVKLDFSANAEILKAKVLIAVVGLYYDMSPRPPATSHSPRFVYTWNIVM